MQHNKLHNFYVLTFKENYITINRDLHWNVTEMTGLD